MHRPCYNVAPGGGGAEGTKGRVVMLKSIQRFFEKKIRPEGDAVTSQKVTEESLRLATAALMIEATKADFEAGPEEMEAVARAVKKAFGISEEETSELVELARERVDEAMSMYPFTRLIDNGFSYDEKKNIVELLWSVVFADSKIDEHEEHFVRRISGLLHLKHEDFIETKLRARESSKKNGSA